MFLLDIAGLCVLVIFCHLYHNLYHFEKTKFDSDCYDAVYDTGSKLCSCISPSYRPRPSIGLPTVTSLPSANVLDKVAAVGATLVISTVQRTTGGTSLVFTIDAANTYIFKTNTTEQTVLAHI